MCGRRGGEEGTYAGGVGPVALVALGAFADDGAVGVGVVVGFDVAGSCVGWGGLVSVVGGGDADRTWKGMITATAMGDYRIRGHVECFELGGDFSVWRGGREGVVCEC